MESIDMPKLRLEACSSSPPRETNKRKPFLFAAVILIIVLILIKSGYETINKVFIRRSYAEPFTCLFGAIINSLHVVFVSAQENTLSCIIEYYIGKGVHENSDFENKKASLPIQLGKLPVESLSFQVRGCLIPVLVQKQSVL